MTPLPPRPIKPGGVEGQGAARKEGGTEAKRRRGAAAGGGGKARKPRARGAANVDAVVRAWRESSTRAARRTKALTGARGFCFGLRPIEDAR